MPSHVALPNELPLVGPGHVVVHAEPQLSMAVLLLHVPLQSCIPVGHAHPPLAHCLPPVHPTHAAPPVPQVAVLDVWHWPLLSQQPVEHDVPSQTHLPAVVSQR